MIQNIKSSNNFLIVGLGNFNLPYTRHSISQLILENLDNFLSSAHLSNPTHSIKFNQLNPSKFFHHRNLLLQSSQSSSNSSSSPWNYSKIDSAWLSKHSLTLSKNSFDPIPSTHHFILHLLKPKALMNVNGPIVKSYYNKLSKNHQPINLILIHDELDLQPLSVKLKSPPQSSKSKGHNGLKSVFSSLSSHPKNHLFTLAIGIGRDPQNLSKSSLDVARWVLSPLNRSEIKACIWDDQSHLNHSHQGKVVIQVWQNILAILNSNI
ncbi:hypothetical protein O181_066245 [Austropuccinia psidii MF-1]|uniref:Peptidyl-tRNA hydrolase n=1 Tax=Austropuccinia psidii MF-1 TaxID=1389203 RepID=A0A9Q3ENM9_9BASI|nr:hypothetical protein [Austropuccinia psidii MF-1]